MKKLAIGSSHRVLEFDSVSPEIEEIGLDLTARGFIFRERILKMLRSGKTLSRPAAPAIKEAGQIWAAKPGPYGMGFPCLITSIPDENGDDVFRIIQLSYDIDFAESWEPKFLGEASPLGVDFFLPIVNERPCFEDKLLHYLGKLSHEAMFAVRAARYKFWQGETPESSRGRQRWLKDEIKITRYLSADVMIAFPS